MGDQGLFHLERADPDGRDLEHVIGAPAIDKAAFFRDLPEEAHGSREAGERKKA